MTVTRSVLDLWRHFLQHPSRGEIETFRDRRLRALVRHAHARVPYYRDLFDESGLDIEGFRGVADLERIPVTTRQTLQSLAPDQILARGYEPSRLVQRWSSGSSGQKLTVRRTWLEDRTLAAFRKRAEHEVGVRPRDRMARITLERGVSPNDAQWPLKMLQSLGLFRYLSIDCLADPTSAIESLRAYRPDVVGGFPGAITRVAEVAGEGRLRDLGVRLIVVGGETLRPEMRRRMETAFGARIVEKYGTIEFDLVAMQCPQGEQLHVCDDGLILEILRGSEAVETGAQGEVVVTGLHSWAMPLIRYRIGDVATKGLARCPCGAPSSTIHSVGGRTLDYFALPDGRLIHPFALTTPMLDAHPWIRQYQLTQERTDHLVLRVVPWDAPSPGLLEEVKQQYSKILGSEVTLDIRLLDELRPEASGKFRLSQSLVRPHHDEFDWERVEDLASDWERR